MSRTKETWKPIASLNNLYEASNTGKIRNAKTLHVLKAFVGVHGYYTMQVCPTPRGAKNVRVHQLVAEAFLGTRPNNMVVNHKDGNKKNNNIENLEYVTSSENNIHALRNGLRHPAAMRGKSPRGESHYRAKITEETVKEVLRLRKEKGYGSRKIAKIIGITNGTVSGILYGRTWKHIKKD